MKRLLYPFLIFITCMSACGSAGIVYPRFVVWPSHDLLLGHDPGGKDDKPLSKTCEPDEVIKGKCIALLTDDFYNMEQELLELRQKTKDLQKQVDFLRNNQK